MQTEASETPIIDPEKLRLFHDETDRLRMTQEADRSWITVRPAWAAPLTRPGKYLALLDGKGEEIVVLPDITVLDSASQDAVRKELRVRYLTTTISKIYSSKQEFGASYWTIECERGRRDFVTQNLQENAQWLSDRHILLVDVDGNRFEIPDTSALDDDSRRLLYNIV